MGEPVPAWIRGRILEPERGGEVDDAADVVDELRHDAHRHLMGQPEEHEIEFGRLDLGDIEAGELKVGEDGRQRRTELRCHRTGVAVGRRQRQLEIGMACQQP